MESTNIWSCQNDGDVLCNPFPKDVKVGYLKALGSPLQPSFSPHFQVKFYVCRYFSALRSRSQNHTIFSEVDEFSEVKST